MLYSVRGFNQEKAINMGLNMIDLDILRYIIIANSRQSMKHIIQNDISYVWISHKKFLEDLPIMQMAEKTFRNRLSNLKKIGIIDSVTERCKNGSKAYYTITEKCESLIYTELACPSDGTWVSSPFQGTPDNNIDKILNTNISKDILVDKSAKDISIDNSKSIVKVKKTVKKEDKKDRWEQFVDAINKFTDDEELRDILVQYADLRLNKISKDDGDYATFYVSKFINILNDLPKLSNDIEMQRKIAQQSLDLKWRRFFPYKKYNNSDFARRGIQMTEPDATSFKDGKEAKEYTDNLKREYKNSGRRAVF